MALNQWVIGAVLAAVACILIFLYVRNDMSQTKHDPAPRDVLQAFAKTVGGSYSYSGAGFSHSVKWAENGVPVELVRRSMVDPVTGDSSSTSVICVLKAMVPLQLHVESRIAEPGTISVPLGNRAGQSITVGVADLDSGYTARASDERRAGTILSQPKVWKALVALNKPNVYFDISARGTELQISYGDEGGIANIERLMNIRALFEATIAQLLATG